MLFAGHAGVLLTTDDGTLCFFDSTRRRLTTVVQDKTGKTQMVTKGAVEEMLSICAYAECDMVLLGYLAFLDPPKESTACFPIAFRLLSEKKNACKRRRFSLGFPQNHYEKSRELRRLTAS